MKKLFYTTNKISENIRQITVYSAGKVFAELECLNDFYNDSEEIQMYLDDNGYSDIECEFTKVYPDVVIFSSNPKSETLIPVHISITRDEKYYYVWDKEMFAWVRGSQIPEHMVRAYANVAIPKKFSYDKKLK